MVKKTNKPMQRVFDDLILVIASYEIYVVYEIE